MLTGIHTSLGISKRVMDSSPASNDSFSSFSPSPTERMPGEGILEAQLQQCLATGSGECLVHVGGKGMHLKQFEVTILTHLRFRSF